MQVELWDIDIPYSLAIDYNEDGEEFVGLKVGEPSEEYALSLSKHQCVELARTLLFLSKQMKGK